MKQRENYYLRPLGDWLFIFLTAKKYRLPRRAGALLLPLLLFLTIKRWGEFEGFYDHLDWLFSYSVLIGIFYANISLLMPRLFYRGKTTSYLFALVGTIAAGLLILFFLHQLLLEHHRVLPKANADESIFTIIGITVFLTPFFLFTTALKLFQRWVNDTRRIDELEKQALHSELKALRHQIQPHFLFNMLNSILVVNKREPELASSIILKLSDFLRYLLYDSNHNEVFLSAEIRFIRDYLELEKIRRDNFTYEIGFDPSRVKAIKLPPYMLLTLVENAIKHSLDPVKDSYIKLDLGLANSKLTISCENSVPLQSADAIDGGLGLVSMNRRLEILFADQFEYEAMRKENCYTVHLSIPV